LVYYIPIRPLFLNEYSSYYFFFLLARFFAFFFFLGRPTADP
jgi:hypothetical protein